MFQISNVTEEKKGQKHLRLYDPTLHLLTIRHTDNVKTARAAIAITVMIIGEVVFLL